MTDSKAAPEILDPAIRFEVLASAAGISLVTLRRAMDAGLTPLADALIDNMPNKPAKGWKLSTLRAWKPDIADRCARIFDASYPRAPRIF